VRVQGPSAMLCLLAARMRMGFTQQRRRAETYKRGKVVCSVMWYKTLDMLLSLMAQGDKAVRSVGDPRVFSMELGCMGSW